MPYYNKYITSFKCLPGNTLTYLLIVIHGIRVFPDLGGC